MSIKSIHTYTYVWCMAHARCLKKRWTQIKKIMLNIQTNNLIKNEWIKIKHIGAGAFGNLFHANVNAPLLFQVTRKKDTMSTHVRYGNKETNKSKIFLLLIHKSDGTCEQLSIAVVT